MPKIITDRRATADGHYDAAPISRQQLVNAELRISNDICTILEHHYPGHQWCVGANLRQEMAFIGIPVLMGKTTWNFHLENIMGPNEMAAAVMKAGGELLERYKIPRTGLDISSGHFLEARAKHGLGATANPVVPA